MNESTKMKSAVIPFTLLSSQERERWIAQCYVLPQANSALYDPERSVLLIGKRGSGLSTIFDVFRHEYALIDDDPAPPLTKRPFCFAYPFYLWPGQPQALFTNDHTSHFKQWMALIAQHLISVFKHQPLLLHALPLTSFEFLVWLMRHYLGARRAELWYRFVEQHHSAVEVKQIVDEARLGKHDNVYTDDHTNDITGQIEECLELVTRLGWSGIYAVTDIGYAEWAALSSEQQLVLQQAIERMLSHLTPIQQRQFGFKIGIIANIIELEKAIGLPRGRATVFPNTWDSDALSAMSTRLLSALAGTRLRIEDIIAPPLWAVLHEDMTSIWGCVCPKALVAVIRAYYELYPLFPLLNLDQLIQLRTKMYMQYAPLRYYPAINVALVWRGETEIMLDEAQVQVFQALWRHGRTKTYAQKEELRLLAGNSSSNLDKIISRIREKIEPFANARIYLQRNQMLGIWLEYGLF